MMNSVRSTLLPAMFLALAACGGEDGTRAGGETSPSQRELSDYLQELAVAECESVAVCPESVHRPYPADIGLALGRGCALFIDATSADRRLLASGHVTLDLAYARLSLEAVRRCNLFGEQLVELALRGTQQLGAQCETSRECASRRCITDLAGCGTCAEGAEPTTAADASTTTTAALGEACDLNTACEAGTYCAGDGQCGEPLAVGEPCSGSDRCVRGSLCSDGNGDDQQHCIAVELLDEGAACDRDSFTLSDAGTYRICDADQSLFCEFDAGVCTKLSRAGLGAACEGRGGCERPFFCDESGTCAVRRGEGEACGSSAACEAGLCSGAVCLAAACG